MNKKTITLRLDWPSKTILFLLSTGIWLMAIKPITANKTYAETITSGELNNTERLLMEICNHLNEIKTDLSLQLKAITSEQVNIQKDLDEIYKRDHEGTKALLQRLDKISGCQLDQYDSIKDCLIAIRSIRGFQGSGTRGF